MNPPLSFTDGQSQLKLLTSQATPANFTFTDDEISQALTTAWNDAYVCSIVFDNSIAFTFETYSYPLPDTVTSVKDIYYKRSSTDFPEVIGRELYEIIDGSIVFTVNARRWLADNYTIFTKGLYKLTTNDTLDTTNLVNYTIWRAAEILLDNLLFKKVFYFLKTDTTVADIVRAKQDVQGNVLRFKQALLREFESA